MGIKASLGKLYAGIIAKKIANWRSNAPSIQEKVFKELIFLAKDTTFGKDHAFNTITSYEEFKKKVPITVYAESTPNPTALKFIANKKLVDSSFEFVSIEDAKYSPLAKALFHFPFASWLFHS